ncbi:hypothetical protein ABZ403_10090 [Micromonospora zamorensis]
MSASRIPHQRLVSLDARMVLAAAQRGLDDTCVIATTDHARP